MILIRLKINERNLEFQKYYIVACNVNVTVYVSQV